MNLGINAHNVVTNKNKCGKNFILVAPTCLQIDIMMLSEH